MSFFLFQQATTAGMQRMTRSMIRLKPSIAKEVSQNDPVHSLAHPFETKFLHFHAVLNENLIQLNWYSLTLNLFRTANVNDDKNLR